MTGALNIIDLLFIAIFFFSVLFGIIRGLVREVLAVCFLIAALVLAFIYYRDIGLLLNEWIKRRELADLAGFLLLLLCAGGAGSLMARLLGKYLVVGPMKAIDRFLGAVFGILRATLLAGIVIYGFIAFPLNDSLLKESRLAPYLISALVAGIKVLPPDLREKLKLFNLYDYEKNSRNSRTI
ncbi:MAG: CvpA family protein [Candidatus Aminicenantes bacterium]|nr:CvpA family protein [Candidatus Aminicenantes bacterium]